MSTRRQEIEECEIKDQEKAEKQRDRKATRRDFMGRGGAAAAVLTSAPRHVLGGPAHRPPSEKLNIAGIGLGRMGRINIDQMSGENIVALCDPDPVYAAEPFKKYPKARKWRDYRKMLDEQKDIEAVVIATPDHTHAVITMAAIRAGKHVFCQKPLTHSIYEARKVTEAARQARVATQTGNQGHAGEGVRLVCEWIWDGAIGAVREVHAWTTSIILTDTLQRPKETPPVPPTLDWDLWLGPAPWRPYHPCYLAWKWIGWWDFGTGQLGNMGTHTLDAAYWALKLGYPISVDASCTKINSGPSLAYTEIPAETAPAASIVRYNFPARGDMPPVKLTWYDGGLMPERPEELEPGRRMGHTYGGCLFVGEKGKLLCGPYGESPRLIPESKMRQYKQPPKTIPRSIGHNEEWIAACKGGKPAGSNFNYSGPLTEVILLGNIAIRTGEKLYWDGPNRKGTNMDVGPYVNPPYRKGWTL